ncbi:golgin subfamily member protein [Populus alba x Populus x berolinensis]|nr:golgin subfamily member protein [Populus alba x Populus x berolinensis]
MSTAKTSSKKRVAESLLTKSASKFRVEDEFDPDLSSDIKGIMSALHQIREKAQKDGLKKNEQTISSVGSEMKSMIDELKSKIEKDRQTFAKALSKSSKEIFEWVINDKHLGVSETGKFQEIYDKFCKEKEAHLQALKDTVSKFEEDKERLCMRYEQMRKKEKSMISEHEKTCADKIAKMEESLKKKKQATYYLLLFTFWPTTTAENSVVRESFGEPLWKISSNDYSNESSSLVRQTGVLCWSL